MNDQQIHEAMALLRQECRQWPSPSVTVVAQQYRSPFTVLISCIISLRTRDAVTAEASERLFGRADTPQTMGRLTEEQIAALIYPTGFYRVKSQQIQAICHRLMEDFDGIVPDTIDQLTSFKGVGRKTANLVVTLGYGKPGICVDIHVHRITNRWGYVTTGTPDKTELALRQKLPPEYWIEINDLLVSYGQHRCFPATPACSCCPLASLCKRIGVLRSR